MMCLPLPKAKITIDSIHQTVSVYFIYLMDYYTGFRNQHPVYVDYSSFLKRRTLGLSTQMFGRFAHFLGF
jgi:hypothetical protein